MRSPNRYTLQRGFTLIEAIMVIVITGVLSAIVASFIARPVQGYLDSVRRAELTDQADAALRRMLRDVRLALPNSLRVTTSAGITYIEFIMTSAGARYRDVGDGSTAGTPLSFSSAAAFTFDVLGTMPVNPAIASNDYVVVYNLGPGNSPADAYSGGNRALVSAVTGNTITLSANPFASQTPPLPSPSARFQVVPGGVKAVTYACATVAANNLSRYANYGFNTTQATSGLGTPALLANGNATCTVDYTSNVMGRTGLLYVSLTLSSGTGSNQESVTLFQQIHVDNSP